MHAVLHVKQQWKATTEEAKHALVDQAIALGYASPKAAPSAPQQSHLVLATSRPLSVHPESKPVPATSLHSPAAQMQSARDVAAK